MNGWPSNDALTANGFPDATANPSLFDTQGVFNTSLPFQTAHFSQQQQQQPQQPQQQQQQQQPPPQQQRAHTPHQYPYPVNPVIPSKRPRPADDGISAS